jgi:glutamate N-acetyltransferase/amino-acid N-acetyltransferase
MKTVDGGVCAPIGYMASGVHAGIKDGSAEDKLDCALVVSTQPAYVAGVFTKNLMKSPPVYWNQKICDAGEAQAVFINSGNANAATGEQGHTDVRTTAEWVANGAQYGPENVCICSTGVIGVSLPMEKIENGVDDCIDSLSSQRSLDAAKAIMTTDTVAKEYAVEFEMGGKTIRIGAIAKGSGMVSPDMATMICILTTDANIAKEAMYPLVKSATDVSFNRICIDNDMSTSDTVMLFANGRSGENEIATESSEYSTFLKALNAVCVHMAHWLVKDGEGATKFVAIKVDGTETDDDASLMARALGNSQLCKTAFFGEDPNWGRFAAAVGYARVPFDPANLKISVDSIVLCEHGIVADFVEEDAAKIMQQDEFTIQVTAGSGPGQAVFWTSDLSHDYVSINADYRT